MSARRRTPRGISADNSHENSPAPSNNVGEGSTLSDKKTNTKSSAELCTDLDIKDVDLEWSDADYQNLITFSIFARMVRPQLMAVNPRTSPMKLTRVLEAKWREFDSSNPFTKKDDTKDGTKSSESSTECDDDEDADEVNGPDAADVNGSVPASPQAIIDQSDDEPELETSKSSKLPKSGLRIKLSLKPVRKSTREHKAPKMMTDKEFDKLLEDDSQSDGEVSRRRRKRKARDVDSDVDDDLSSDEDYSATRSRDKRRRKANIDADGEYSGNGSQQASASDEEYEGSSDSDSPQKKKKARPMIPGERKSTRSRRVAGSMMELTDREFEKLLVEEEKQKKELKERRKKKAKREHRSSRGRILNRRNDRSKTGKSDESEDEKSTLNKSDKQDRSKEGGESGNESDHIWYCELCKDGGDLLLCDTCPKSFHKECLRLEIVPDGEWSCPICTGEGLPEKGDTSEEDDHDTFCRVCKDGGDVILCDFCPLVYHMNCLHPPMKNLPDGDWKCPICVARENPPKAKVKHILTWRWKHQPKDTDELDHTHSPQKQAAAQKADDEDSNDSKNDQQRMKGPERELFVKYEFHSYWDCDWISELQLEVHQMLLHAYFKRKFYLDEPPALEDGSSFGRPRHKTGMAEDDPHNLEERYYRYGIKPEWMQIHRIIMHDGASRNSKDCRYLVKWRDLPYSECTWEFPDDVPEGLEDWAKHVDAYWTRRKQKQKEERESKRFDAPKKSVLRKKLDEQPEYLGVNGGKLHPYQLEGLNWLRFSWSQGTNTILADEMGLGKTIQAIAFLYGLWKEGYVHKPFIISAPLTTVPNWEREFELWAPEMYVLTYVGLKENRMVIREQEFSYKEGAFATTNKPCKMRDSHRPKFDVLLTSYEFVSHDFPTLSSIDWDVLIIDEAHRLKNNQSLFFRTLSEYKIKYKLLLTGTPLQNNLEELFNLLNFLEPGKFMQMEEFLAEFSEISKDEQVLKLHDMLAPHMLRRMKADVLKDIPSKHELIVRVELSSLQKKFYKHILTKNYDALNAKGYGNQTSLMNIMMDLRKCCNHPYMFPGAEKDAPLTSSGVYEGSAMTKASGKLELLAKMLKVLKQDGHRVLIFSQMTRVLDILEDFLSYHQYGYERIDGSCHGNKRQESIDRFNSEDSKQFVFLLSTRAGGLGINLATADTVVIYDMDWNPHNDIQAFSRAHRIGQRNKVMIYRFVSRNTVEEKMAQVCKQKMMLSELIVHRGMGGTNVVSNEKKESLTKQEINDILKYGAENLFKDDEEGQVVYNDEAVQKLLDRDQEGEMEKEKEFGMNEYLRSFKVASYQVKEGIDEEEEAEEEKEEDTEVTEAADDSRRTSETDVQYWQRVLGPAYHEHVVQTLREQEEVAKTLGKGKRIRKQINYAEQEMIAAAEGTKAKKKVVEEAAVLSDYQPTSESSEEDEVSGPEAETGNDLTKRRKLHKHQVPKAPAVALPPLVERTDGQVLVLGFTARQRRAFLDAIMRYGLPPEDPYRSQWLVRDLRGKPERVFKAYVSLFMRHLCEPVADNVDKFADGVPREGLSRQHVLTRIGIIALIRKKVHEFEDVHGIDSMIYFKSSLKANQTQGDEANGEKKESSNEKPADRTESTAAAAEVEGTDKAEERSSTGEAADTGTVNEQLTETDAVSQKDQEGTADVSEENHEKMDQEVDVAQAADSERCEEESSKNDRNEDEGGDRETEEKKTESEETEQTTSGDAVAMEVGVDVPQPQSSADKEQDSSRPDDGEDKGKDVDEPMETDAADDDDVGAADESDITAQDEQQTCSETQNQAHNETSESTRDKDTEPSSSDGPYAANSTAAAADITDSNAADTADAVTNITDSALADSNPTDSAAANADITDSTAADITDGAGTDEKENADDKAANTESATSQVAVAGDSVEKTTNDATSTADKTHEPRTTEDTRPAEQSTSVLEPPPQATKSVDQFSSVESLRHQLWIADGGFTELHALWQLEEKQLEKSKEYATWFRLHDFWLLAGVVTHGYRHWQDILSDQRFDLLNHAFLTDSDKARKAAFLNRRFQLIEQALVVEEQLRKSVSENPAIVEHSTASQSLASVDKFTPLDELASTLRSSSQSSDSSQPKNVKLQKVLAQIIALVNDINDASYTNMPASLARTYAPLQAQRPLVPKVVTLPVRPNMPTPMTVMSAPSQWAGYRPVAATLPPRPIIIQPQTVTPVSTPMPSSSSTTAAAAASSSSSAVDTKDVICIDD